MTGKDFATALDVAVPTANSLVREFERLGILTEITGQQRGRVFVFQRYLDLFLS